MTTGMAVETVRGRAGLAEKAAAWKAAGLSVGLVPTMGALHRGHLSLVERLARHVDRVVVSIFVNPTQFGPNEDFASYPRDEARDLALLSATPAALVYLPEAAEIYGAGDATRIRVAGIADDLEGRERPGHFEGVATVVCKLLNHSRADAAIFGEKDYQQLLVIRRMVADLGMPCDIYGAPIVREPDGLAASSRNAYLTTGQRAIAVRLPQTLRELAARAEEGEPIDRLAGEGVARLLAAGFDRVDYLSFRDAETLAPIATLSQPSRLLAVARLGRTRLLDNLALGPALKG
ncbi:MAG: pantoate--beta-alanine ligase [Rhodothalassiaceae bacterium]